MKRSRALSRTFWLLKRYGFDCRQLGGPAAALCQQISQSSSDLNIKPSSTTSNLRLPAGNHSGAATLFKRLHEHACFSPCFPRGRLPVDFYFCSPVAGIRFLSAQPLPIKSPGSDESENELPSAEKSRKVSASAMDVDKALEDYDKALDKHRKYYSKRYDSTPLRIWTYVIKGFQIVPMTWNFFISLPGTLWRAVFSPWSVKWAWTQSQWKNLKDGTHHYWVSGILFVVWEI